MIFPACVLQMIWSSFYGFKDEKGQMEPKRIIAKFDNFCILGPICMRAIKFSFNSYKS